MVLHLGEKHAVSGFQVCPRPTEDYEVQRFGCIPDEHYLFRVLCPNEASKLLPRPLKGDRRPLAQSLDASVNVSVVFAVVSFDCLDDLHGFLRGSGVVQIDEPLGSYLPLENRENRLVSCSRRAALSPVS